MAILPHGNSSLKMKFMKFDVYALISCFHHIIFSIITYSILHHNQNYRSHSVIPDDVIKEMALEAIEQYDLKLTMGDFNRKSGDDLPPRKQVKVKYD